jgi:hypothetical protein
MSGIDRTIECAATFGFERVVQSAARFFRPTFDFDPLERQVKRDHLAIVVRIWLVSIFLLTIPAVVITIFETIQTKYFLSAGSAHIHHMESPLRRSTRPAAIPAR